MSPLEVWTAVGVGIALVVAVSVVLYFTRWRRRPAPVEPESEEAGLLREAEQIAAHFRGIGTTPLGIRIPLPEINIDRQQVVDFNTTAGQIADTLRRATLWQQIATEMRRGAEAMSRSLGQVEQAHTRAAEEVRRAYETLGLEPPPMRTEQEVQAAHHRLQQAMAQLQAVV